MAFTSQPSTLDCKGAYLFFSTILCIIILDFTLEVASYDFKISRKFETEYFGNEVLHNKKLLNPTPHRMVYIEPHDGLVQGVVMEMYVYIESSTDVYLQIWRPRVLEQKSGSFNLTLIGQKLLPRTHTGNYSIMLTPEERFLVEDGDLLGFTVDGATCPVSVLFDKDPTIQHLRARLESDADIPELGETVTFKWDDLPYRFSYAVAVMPGVFNVSAAYLYELVEFSQDCDDVDHECQQGCRAIDDKYICECYPGFSLNDDQKTCSDVDECSSDNGKCEHTCMNTLGGYRCSCPEGFQLSSNRHSCMYMHDTCEKMHCGPDEKCLQGYKRAYCIGTEVVHVNSCSEKRGGIKLTDNNSTLDYCPLNLSCSHMMSLVIWCVILTVVLVCILLFLLRRVMRQVTKHKTEEREAEVRLEDKDSDSPVDFSPRSVDFSPSPVDTSPRPAPLPPRPFSPGPSPLYLPPAQSPGGNSEQSFDQSFGQSESPYGEGDESHLPLW